MREVYYGLTPPLFFYAGMSRSPVYGVSKAYSGSIDALLTIAREEGMRGLYKGGF